MKIINCFKYLGVIIYFILSQNIFASPIAENSENEVHFLSTADIHFNPFSSCKTVPCPLIEKLQKTSGQEWAKVFDVLDNSKEKYYEDTNYALLKSALEEFKKEADKENIRFVLVLGDFLAHEMKEKYAYYTNDKSFRNYSDFIKKTLEFISFEFNQAFPHKDVFMVVGNNDSYEDDYVFTLKGKFFHEIGQQWSRLIKDTNNSENMRDQFSEGGYYAINLPEDKDLRLIILNSVIFSKNACCNNIKKAATNQLAWLRKELESSRKNNQKVILIMHIPPGVDVYSSVKKKLFTVVEFWQPTYNESFQKILDTYSSSIMAILSAHTHMDWFQTLTNGYHENILISSTPAISPLFGNNAAFKIYTYSTSSLQLQNFSTYSKSLKGNHGWQQEYNFNEVYQPKCKNCTLDKAINFIHPAGKLADFYKNHYSVGNQTQPINTKWFPYYWCQMRTMSSSNYIACIDQTKKDKKINAA